MCECSPVATRSRCTFWWSIVLSVYVPGNVHCSHRFIMSMVTGSYLTVRCVHPSKLELSLDVILILDQRHRRWSNITMTLGQPILFAGHGCFQRQVILQQYNAHMDGIMHKWANPHETCNMKYRIKQINTNSHNKVTISVSKWSNPECETRILIKFWLSITYILIVFLMWVRPLVHDAILMVIKLTVKMIYNAKRFWYILCRTKLNRQNHVALVFYLTSQNSTFIRRLNLLLNINT